MQIATSTYGELRDIRLPAQTRVPTLAEVVAAVRGRGLLVLDLKFQGDAAGLAASVLEVLRRRRLRDGVVLSSFSADVLEAIRRPEPRWPRALITGPEVPAVVGLSRARGIGCSALHPYATTVLADHGVAERAVEYGMALRCWTVNRPVDARLLAIAGVPAVISDDPTGLRRDLAAPSRNRVP